MKKSKGTKRKIFVYFVLFVLLISSLITSEVIPASDSVRTLVSDNITKYVNVVELFETNGTKIFDTIMIVAITIVVVIVSEVLLGSLNFGRRSKTISKLLHNILSFFAYMVMIFSILMTWGLEAAQVAALFGAIALAVGFAAQGVIGDILSGVFNVFENQFSVGDIIEINDFRGRVVEIGFRSLKCQNWKGDILIIRNSSYDSVINFSKALSTAVCDISIAYSEDVLRAEKVIKAISPKLREKYKAIKDGPFYLGVQSLGESDVSLRVIAKVRERDRLQVERDLNRELKASFDKNKINIPFPQLVIHKGENEKFSSSHARIIADIIEGKTDKVVETADGTSRLQSRRRSAAVEGAANHTIANRPTTSLSEKVDAAKKTGDKINSEE